MAATVGSMRLTARSLLVPKTFVNALLIKNFLWALLTTWADSLFYAMMHTTPVTACRSKKGRQGSNHPDGLRGESIFTQNA
jgi:hypothetical protein